MDNKIKVKTKFNSDMIMIETVYPNTETIMSQAVKEILNLKERAVREALIKLGWTPPDAEIRCPYCGYSKKCLL